MCYFELFNAIRRGTILLKPIIHLTRFPNDFHERWSTKKKNIEFLQLFLKRSNTKFSLYNQTFLPFPENLN